MKHSIFLQLFVWILVSNPIFSCDHSAADTDRRSATPPPHTTRTHDRLILDFPSREEDKSAKFMKETAHLIEVLESTPPERRRDHLVVFDIHGVLTTLDDPDYDDPELPYGKVIALYHRLESLGATVLISSAWHDAGRNKQSLRSAGIHVDERHEIITVGSYEISHNFGNVISVREIENAGYSMFPGSVPLQPRTKQKYFKNKGTAALWYARKQGITNILSVTLLDDSCTNCALFIGQLTMGAFGFRITDAKRIRTILVPKH